MEERNKVMRSHSNSEYYKCNMNPWNELLTMQKGVVVVVGCIVLLCGGDEISIDSFSTE